MVDMIAAGVEYEDGTMSPWEDRVSVLVDMTFGGIATTTYVLASAINWLAENPKARQLLIDDPDTYMPRAIEEFARVFAPVVALGRTCTKDVEIGGRMLSEGDFILMMYAGVSGPRCRRGPEEHRHHEGDRPPLCLRGRHPSVHRVEPRTSGAPCLVRGVAQASAGVASGRRADLHDRTAPFHPRAQGRSPGCFEGTFEVRCGPTRRSI